jgi:serine/threonine protein kinase
MRISDDNRKFREAYPESVPKRVSFKKGDFIGQKYEVIDILGEGGCGTVYLVYYNQHDQFYALKTFKGEYLDSELVKDRFRKEAQVWIDLDKHPYLVRAYWVEEISNRLFIGMEWIAPEEEGSPNSLDVYLKQSPPDLPQSLRWAIQFCYGMEYAYSKGIKAHRDIKPANIMIDHNKTVRISDFGLAGIAKPGELGQNINIPNQHQTMLGTSMGTPTHMSPEQFLDAVTCDERSDIYSFGIVLFQMASGGRLPFFTDNHNHFWSVLKHLHNEAEVPKLDSLLFPQIKRCLEKEPGKRYQSFKALRADLEAIHKRLTGEAFTLQKAEEMNSADWNNKGISFQNLSRFKEAIECFDEAINVDPLNAGAWHNKSFSLRALGKPSEALNCCDSALNINPSNAGALFNKGSLLADLGQLDKALLCFNLVLDIKPVYMYLISQIGGMLGLYDFAATDVKAICEKIVKLNLKPSDIDGLLNLGLIYYQLEDIDYALSLFLKAEKLDEEDCGVWFELMNIYFKKQDADNTIKYCDKLITNKKYTDLAMKNKSIILSITGKMKQAIGLLKDALDENEYLDVLWITLSGFYERTKCFDEAIIAAKKCLYVLETSKSKDSTNIAYVSNVISRLYQKQASSASPEIEQALRKLESTETEHCKQKPHTDAIKQLIQLYLNDGDEKKALHYCDLLIETTNYITDFGNKAIVMSYFGDSTGAIKLLHEILNERPHLDSLWFILSDIYEKKGDIDAAFKAAYNCKKALQKSENPNPQNLADVEARLNALRR